MECSNEPYALRDADERERRRAMLTLPHMAPLTKYLAEVREMYPTRKIPSMDPCDGGIRARVLFLLEAPGPQAINPQNRKPGSGFVSRNNPDPTAKNLCLYTQQKNIAREDTLIWNIVPWYVGIPDGSKIIPAPAKDIREALPHLKTLLILLPDLKMIVLMGKKAQSAEAQIAEMTIVPVLKTFHTSSQVMNVWPHRKQDVLDCLDEVATRLRGETPC